MCQSSDTDEIWFLKILFYLNFFQILVTILVMTSNINKTEPPQIKFSILHKINVHRLKVSLKILWFHLSIASLYEKKLHWFISSILIYILFMELQAWLGHSIYDPIFLKDFKWHLTFPEFYQDSKYQADCPVSWNTVVLRILQSNWLKAFVSQSITLTCIFNTANCQITFYLTSIYISMKKITLLTHLLLIYG